MEAGGGQGERADGGAPERAGGAAEGSGSTERRRAAKGVGSGRLCAPGSRLHGRLHCRLHHGLQGDWGPVGAGRLQGCQRLPQEACSSLSVRIHGHQASPSGNNAPGVASDKL